MRFSLYNAFAKLFGRVDKELVTNHTLSINFTLHNLSHHISPSFFFFFSFLSNSSFQIWHRFLLFLYFFSCFFVKGIIFSSKVLLFILKIVYFNWMIYQIFIKFFHLISTSVKKLIFISNESTACMVFFLVAITYHHK